MFRTLDAGPATATALARGLGITLQGASKLVAEMVERGYVVREADPGDARVKQLRLGPRGEGALAAARAFHRAYERKLIRRIGAERAGVVREVLTALAADEGAAATAPRL